jgi:hypothetical protein
MDSANPCRKMSGSKTITSVVAPQTSKRRKPASALRPQVSRVPISPVGRTMSISTISR